MSLSDAELRSVLRAASPGDRQDLIDAEAALRGWGPSQGHRLLRAVLALQAGFAPATPAPPGRAQLNAAVDELAAAVKACSCDLPTDVTAVEIDPMRSDGDAADTLLQACEFLVDALAKPEPADEAMRASLAGLEVALRLAGDDEVGEPSSETMAVRLASASLRLWWEEVAAWARPPAGGERLFHAAARWSEQGLGPYGRNLSCVIANGGEVLDLVAYTAGACRSRWEPWAVLLSHRLEGRWLHELIEAVADEGLPGTLSGLLARILRGRDQPPDRYAVERLRDAALDYGELELGLQAQAALVAAWPEDKNEHMALGDLLAALGRTDAAREAFTETLRLSPGEGHARRALERLEANELGVFSNREGFGTSDEKKAVRRAHRRGEGIRIGPSPERVEVIALGEAPAALAPEIAPRGPEEVRQVFHAGLHLRRLGARRERSREGWLPSLAGVEAVRGFWVSAHPVLQVRVLLGRCELARLKPRSHPISADPGGRRKHVFNAWVDVSAFAPGRYALQVEARELGGGVRLHEETVLVAPPRLQAEFPSSDAVVDPPPVGEPLEVALAQRPSMTREGRRTFLSAPPQKVLVVRADQLGDLVCSIPALRRLREIVPEARITGLVSAANADLARTLDLFDEVMTVEFPDDPLQRGRVLPLDRQVELKAELESRRFDLAIDFSDVGGSRPLLSLTGAPVLYGGDRWREFPYLDLSFDAGSRDPVNGSERVPAVTKMLGLVEWLGLTLRSHAPRELRSAPVDDQLSALDLRAKGFVLLHTGARLAFSRWPNFAALAGELLTKTSLDVAVVGGDTLAADPALVASPRVRLLPERIAFDQLDALSAACAVFVGGDSGPKHLAALRGAPVVSLHCARNNWNEWGQESGLILSRRVPCAGCQITYDAEECGRDFVCVTAIGVDEVLDAILRVLVANPT